MTISLWRRGGLITAMLAALGACTAMELPDPPDMSALAVRYDFPTAHLGPETAGEFLLLYFEQRERLATVNDLEVVTETVGEFVESTSYGEDDTVEINGVPIRTDAHITVTGDCPGWDDDGALGRVVVEVIVRQSSIVPVAWGIMEDCRAIKETEARAAHIRLSGGVRVYVPGLSLDDEEDTDEELQVYLVSYDLSSIEVDDDALTPWAGSFRMVDELIEVLVENADRGTIVAYNGSEPRTIGVRAANGHWLCQPEERRCEPVQSPDPSFSY